VPEPNQRAIILSVPKANWLLDNASRTLTLVTVGSSLQLSFRACREMMQAVFPPKTALIETSHCVRNDRQPIGQAMRRLVLSACRLERVMNFPFMANMRGL
jgi:hypothetical protein